MIEATDMDSLLEQFEGQMNTGFVKEIVPDEDPKRKAQIYAAVKSHFTGPHRRKPLQRMPKIGKKCQIDNLKH